MSTPSSLKIALVHHWLVTRRGGEHVLAAMLELFPHADLFTLVYDRERLPAFAQRNHVRTSFLQHFPAATRWYPRYLPFFPWATERLNLSGYDLVISSDAATLKGVRTDPGAVHICYCHTPMRYVWNGYQVYSKTAGGIGRLVLRVVRPRLRAWDFRAAQGVTHFVANSQNVQKRIQDSYERESTVIYPPVDTDQFIIPHARQTTGDFFLLASQLVPYKRADLVVEAFNYCGRPLIVIGDGPERRALERLAKPNVRFLGYQPQAALVEAMQHCRAFVFAGEEDFGIVMAEAQACGTPVIALDKGGAQEIVTDESTGILFQEQSSDSLLEALERFQRVRFERPAIRAAALRFGRQRFLREFQTLVEEQMTAQRGRAATRRSTAVPAVHGRDARATEFARRAQISMPGSTGRSRNRLLKKLFGLSS